MSQAAGTRPANDTFAVRHTGIRTASRRSFSVSRSARRGRSFVCESTRACELLGTNLAAVEYYNVKFCLWTRIDISYTHILTPDTYLLLRRIGVSGLDEERLIDHFVNLPGSQHIRYDLTVERDAVRHKLKVRSTKANSEDEVEIVRVNGIKIEPDTDSSRMCLNRPALRIVTGSAGTIAANPICLSDDPTPSSSTTSTSSSSSPPLST
ncbi:hypothetical protein B0H13DRAFT_2306658 [Mycena leptocephala]|nr:hypothetical protein B0H13DRAFT_2306658 [Mycena leptocephala]